MHCIASIGLATKQKAQCSSFVVDVFYQETNYVTLLIFWLLTDVCFLLLHVSFIFDCLVYFFIILYYVYDFIIK